MSKLIKTASWYCALALTGWWFYHQPVGPRPTSNGKVGIKPNGSFRP